MLGQWRNAVGLEALASKQAAYNEMQNTIDAIDIPVTLPGNTRATPV